MTKLLVALAAIVASIATILFPDTVSTIVQVQELLEFFGFCGLMTIIFIYTFLSSHLHTLAQRNVRLENNGQ